MGKRILYLQYTNPANYPPLEHSALILQDAGFEIRFFGVQSEGESNKLAFPESLARGQTLWQHQPGGGRQKLQFVAFTLTALWRTLWEGPAWVYCSDLMSCPAAWLIGRFTRCRVLYHEHDSPDELNADRGKLKAEPENPPSGLRPPTTDLRAPSSAFQCFLLWCRQRVGRGADLVVLPNPKRLELFCQNSGRQKKSLCVFNCPRRAEVAAHAREPGSDGVLRLAFHGSINRDRLPSAVLEAMSRFPGRIHLSVVGYETVGSQGYLNEFLTLAGRLGLANAVEFIGALPARRAMLDQAARCDVGLAFMPLQSGDVNMANMTGASNKPFDYLACGLALLVSARPDWEEMFVHPGCGLPCNSGDADSMATQLQWFLEHPLETRAMGERGRRRLLAEWNYESQFDQVVKWIQIN